MHIEQTRWLCCGVFVRAERIIATVIGPLALSGLSLRDNHLANSLIRKGSFQLHRRVVLVLAGHF